MLRDGEVVGSKPASELDIDEVIAMMVGRRMENKYPYEAREVGEPLLNVQGLSGERFQDVSFHVKAGEVVGFAGLMGAGRTEVMRALFGLDHADEGTVHIGGKQLKRLRVTDSISAGMVMLSEDRRRYGLVGIRSIKENVSLASLRNFIHGGRLHSAQEREEVTQACDRMRVKAPNLETTVEALSGGNQHKVVLAKWIVCNPQVFLLDEPTRGIDVGAKFEIYKLMIDLAKRGKGIVMISSELPELIGMCDRIYVMCHGRIAGELAREDFSAEDIMALATGVSRAKLA